MKTHKIYFTKYLLFFGVMFMFWSCEDNAGIEIRNWELVWQDEFNTITTDSLPDANKWTYDEGAGGWGNAEWQTYTKSKSNVKIDIDYSIGLPFSISPTSCTFIKCPLVCIRQAICSYCIKLILPDQLPVTNIDF